MATREKKSEEKEAQEGERQPLPASLAGRIAAVMGEVSRVEKAGFNKFFQYKYVTSEDIKDLIRPLLAKYGIAIVPQMEEVIQESRTNEKGKTKFYTRLKMAYWVMSTDGVEILTIHWESESQDDEDKGINKALTASLKNFLLNLFQVSTGDEVDIETDPVLLNGEPDANGALMDQISRLYHELFPGVKGNVLPGLFAKVCGKDARFTQENAGRVLEALAKKKYATPPQKQGAPPEEQEGASGPASEAPEEEDDEER